MIFHMEGVLLAMQITTGYLLISCCCAQKWSQLRVMILDRWFLCAIELSGNRVQQMIVVPSLTRCIFNGLCHPGIIAAGRRHGVQHKDSDAFASPLANRG